MWPSPPSSWSVGIKRQPDGHSQPLTRSTMYASSTFSSPGRSPRSGHSPKIPRDPGGSVRVRRGQGSRRMLWSWPSRSGEAEGARRPNTTAIHGQKRVFAFVFSCSARRARDQYHRRTGAEKSVSLAWINYFSRQVESSASCRFLA